MRQPYWGKQLIHLMVPRHFSAKKESATKHFWHGPGWLLDRCTNRATCQETGGKPVNIPGSVFTEQELDANTWAGPINEYSGHVGRGDRNDAILAPRDSGSARASLPARSGQHWSRYFPVHKVGKCHPGTWWLSQLPEVMQVWGLQGLCD